MNSEWPKSSWQARFAQRVPVRDVPRVPSGSPATVLLRARRYESNAIGATLALAKRHLSLRAAREVATRLFDEGSAVATLPMLESFDTLASELSACAVEVKPYGPPKAVDVRAVRERAGLSQEEFASAYGLEVATIRNWEQRRSEPDAASRVLLAVLARRPEAIRDSLEEIGTEAVG